jgi:hypothetical protein
MFVEVEIGGERYEGIGELASVLSHLHFEPDTPLEATKPGNCLRYVDLEGTAEANGFIYRPTEDRFYAIFDRR